MSWRVLHIALLSLFTVANAAAQGSDAAEELYRKAYRDYRLTAVVADTLLASPYTTAPDRFWAKLARISAGMAWGDRGMADTLESTLDDRSTLLQRYAVAVEQMRAYRYSADNEGYFRAFYKAQHYKNRIDDASPGRNAAMIRHLNLRFWITAARYYKTMKLPSEAAAYLRQAHGSGYLVADTAAYVSYLLTSSELITSSDTASLLHRFDALSEALRLSRASGNGYAEAQTLLSASALLRHSGLTVFEENRPGECSLIAGTYGSEDELFDKIPLRAFHIASKLDSRYLTAASFVSMADNAFSRGDLPASAGILTAALDTLGTNFSPELEASIYEKLSIINASMGDKYLSDYYRNAYLDILELTRSDKSQESYSSLLATYTSSLRLWFVLSALGCVAFLLIVVVVGRRWKKAQSRRMERMESLREAFGAVVEGTLDKVETEKTDDENLLGIATLINNYALAGKTGKTRFDDNLDDINEQIAMLDTSISVRKEQNLEMRAKVSMAAGIMPYLDRFIHRIGHTTEGDYPRQLLERIIAINSRLTEWIVMSRGIVSLSVESFPLSDVLDFIRCDEPAFRKRGITLDVPPTQLCVKADKALTLFMINTLVANARRFTPSEGTVRVSAAETTDNMVEIAIEDNGRGMTEEKVRSLLAMNTETQSRVGGFGIMNCLGIIDKYRKTSALFARCTFDISSTEGKGSRVSFTLPTGLRKALSLIAFAFFAHTSAHSTPTNEGKSAPRQKASDALLIKAATFADSAFYSNINSTYALTLQYADSVYSLLNRYALSQGDTSQIQPYAPTASDPDRATELQWWSKGLYSDYNILLDIRNESAVACLALNRTDEYIYNNEIYLTLYRLMTEDPGISSRIAVRSRLIRAYTIGIGAVLITAFAVVILLYLKYLRRSTISEVRMRNLLAVYTALLSPKPLRERLDDALVQASAICPLRGWAVVVSAGGEDVMSYTSQGFPYSAETEVLTREVLAHSSPRSSHGAHYLPLFRADEQSREAFGVLTLSAYSPTDFSEAETSLHEVARFVARLLEREVLQGEVLHDALEQAEDHRRLLELSNYRLHIQNAILENSLSTIKHETLYYPGRLQKMMESPTDTAEILTVARHYRDLYATLLSRAERQITQTYFRWSFVPISHLVPGMSIECDTPVYVEESLITHLLKSLIKMISRETSERPSITYTTADPDFVRITISFPLSPTLDFTGEAAITAFAPETARPEMLLGKEIIRIHNEKTAHSGYRIGAETHQTTSTIWFTLLKKNI